MRHFDNRLRALPLGALLLTFVTPAAHADTPNPTPTAAWTRPYLWRIESRPPSYLTGTMHLPDVRSAHFPPSLLRSLEATREVVLELELDLLTGLKVAFRLFAPAGQRLSDLAPPSLLARYRRAVESHGGNFALMARLSVWGAGMMLESMPHVGDQGAVLDQALSQWAEAHGRTVAALETIDEQLAVGGALPVADQLALLTDQLDELERDHHEEDELRELFFSGDDARAAALLRAEKSEKRPAQVAFNRRLIDERNQRMATRIRARLADGTPRLFAVGLAHLVGDGGVVALLRRAGVPVVRVER